MVVSPILVALLLLLLITKYYGNTVYRIAAVIAFLGHVFVSLIVVPLAPYGWDIGNFHEVAIAFTSGEFASASSTVTAFGTFQGLLYVFFPSQPETIAIFNGLFAILVFLPISYLCKQLYPKLPETQYGVMILVLFLPLPFYLMSLPMRDALSVLLFFSVLALGVRSLFTRNALLAFTGIPLWGMTFLMRPELALVLVLGFTAAVGVHLIRTVELDLSLTGLTAMLGVIGLLGVGLFAEFMYSLERANLELSSRARGGAVYLEGMQYSSWFDFLLVAPTRAIYFQFAPFPLHVDQIFHLLAFIMTPIVIVLFISAVRSLYECEYDETVAVLLVVVYLAGITGYGLINSNFGTNVRHRIIFEFLLILMAAPVIKRWELYVREWLRVVPRYRSQHEKEQRKTEKLNRNVQPRGQYPNETEQ